MWLSQNPSHWPSHQIQTPLPLPEERTQSHLVCPTATPGRLVESSRFSSYCSQVRVTAWILRFVRHARRRRSSSGELDASDLMDARSYWTESCNWTVSCRICRRLRRETLLRESPVARFNPFWNNGYSRIGGRLQFADLSKEQILPILLHFAHHFQHC